MRIKFGRRKKEGPEDFQQYYRLWTQGEITVRQAAEKLRMSKQFDVLQKMQGGGKAGAGIPGACVIRPLTERVAQFSIGGR